MCCSVLQCVAVAVCCSGLSNKEMSSVLQCVAVCCSVLQCVAVAVFCSGLSNKEMSSLR